MCNEVLKKRITNLKARIDDFISSKTDILDEKYDEIIDEYEDISLGLINLEDLPGSVVNFLSYKYEDPLPQEYSELNAVLKLGKYSYDTAKKEIKKNLKSVKIKKCIDYTIKALKSTPQNSSLLYLFEKLFKKAKLYSELLELYKTIFFHTFDPICCEKMGDTYMILKDYEKSIEYYLNYAELTENNAEIYLKLAKAFKKTNDNDSYNACIAQAKRISEGEQ